MTLPGARSRGRLKRRWLDVVQDDMRAKDAGCRRSSKVEQKKQESGSRIEMLPLLLLFILSVHATPLIDTDNIDDDCMYVYDNQNYRRTSILNIRGLPTNLAYNPNNGELYFTLIDLESLQNDEVQTKMDQYALKNGEPIKVDNVNGQAAAVDIKNQKVYIASDDGLNLLNQTYKANFFSFKDEDIVQLFKPVHKDELYAVMYPENQVYAIDLKKNEKSHIENIPCAYILAVDADDNVYFECDSKYMKVLLKGFEMPIEFVGINKNAARAIAVDDNDRVVLAANDGLYHLKPDNLIPKKLMDVEYMPSGISFNGEDLYIATSGMIYKYTRKGC